MYQPPCVCKVGNSAQRAPSFPFHCWPVINPCATLLSVAGLCALITRFTVEVILSFHCWTSPPSVIPVSLLAIPPAQGRLIPHKLLKVDIPARTKVLRTVIPGM